MRSLRYVVTALLAMASTSAAQSIIYMDYTSGFSTILPGNPVNAIADSRTYITNTPGSYRFGVDWNNDAEDEFTITVPVTVHVFAENNAAFCTPNSTTTPPNQITFTTSSPHQCNYTANWTTPFSGVLTVTYNQGANLGGQSRSDAISTFFVNTSTTVVGDPQFVGLRGQSYQVHGIDGAVYNLISGKSLQVNSRFVFLTKGDCPVFDGLRDTNCWSHPGSYLGEMSFQALVDGKLHTALVTSGSAKNGFASVEVDGAAVKVGAVKSFGSFSLEWKSSHRVLVSTAEFDFELDNSDLFINQAVRSKVALSKLSTHGLLGQTHSGKKHSSSLKFIEGEVDDYAIEHSDIFGTDFMFNQFQA